MCIYKRGDVYWYKFMWQGCVIRESTKQGNDKVARQMEAAHRTRLAEECKQRQEKAELLGCPTERLARCPGCDKWYDIDYSSKASDGKSLCSNACRLTWERRSVPTLRDFCEKRFEPWAQATFERTCRNNWYWFRAGIRRLKAYEPLATCKLDEVTNERVAGFAAHEQTRLQNRGRYRDEEKRGLAVSSINSAIRVLRRVLSFAVEGSVIESAPKLDLLPGERHRERVITPDEEVRYLAAASPLLSDVATVLADTGMRPDECYRLRWEDLTWANGRNGSLLVRYGKTAAARRVLPMTPRVRAIIEARWNLAGKPLEGWLWPAPTASGHIDHSSLKKQHTKAFHTVNAEARKSNLRPITPFVLYSFRHTFLTRLGQSGCDAWTLARIAGHSSIAISSRYVHPSEDVVLDAMARLGGHNSGHSEIGATVEQNAGKELTHVDMYNYQERARSSAG
jgi:integrase